MPKLLERLVSQLKAKGMGDAKAYAVATSTMEKSGNMKDGKLTAKGQARQAMGAAGRAKDRAAKASGKSSNAFNYSSKTNRATLK